MTRTSTPARRRGDACRALAAGPPVLVIEDSDTDYALVASALRRAEFTLIHASTIAAASELLDAGDVGCVVLDLGLPDAAGLDALQAVLARTTAAVIVLTGLHDEVLALEAVSRGAQDYLLKGDFTPATLERAIRYAMERTRSRQLTERMARLQGLKAEVNKSVARTHRRDRLLADACRIAVDVGGFRMAWAGLADGSELAVVAASGHIDGYLDAITVPVASDGPTATCLRTNATVIANDIDRDPRMEPWREAANARGYRASAAFPLLVDGTAIGAISVYAGRTGEFTEAEVGLLEGLVADIAAAIARFEADDARRRSEQRFHSLVQNSSDLIVVVDEHATLSYGSPAAQRLLGRDSVALAGTDVFDLIHPDDHPRIREAYAATLQRPGVHDPEEVRLRHADGTWRDFEIIGNNLIDDPAVAGVVINGRDITDRKAAEELVGAQARILGYIARGVPVNETLGAIAVEVERRLPGRRCVVTVADDELHHLEVIAAPSLPTHVLHTLAPLAIVEGDTPCGAAAATHQTIVVYDVAAERRFRSIRPLVHEAGIRSCWSTPIRAYGGEHVLGTLAIYGAETGGPAARELAVAAAAENLAAIAIERSHAERRLSYQALHDSLTDLPNRALFLDRLQQATHRAARDGTRAAVMLLDLDRFKVVNDSLGHAAGDQLLVIVADRIRAVVGPSDTVARFGGDEFAVLCEHIYDDEEAAATAQRIHEALTDPVEVDGQRVHISASIGIASAPGSGEQPDHLVRDADVAMYQAKKQGRSRTSFFDQATGLRAAERLSLENALRRAVDAGAFDVYYQPEFDLRSGACFGAEALVRWHDPERGSVPPSVFIPVAEETGLIWRLGRQVLESACRTARQWQVDGNPTVVSVNLSAVQLSDPRLVEMVSGILADTALPSSLLCLEITESVLMEDADKAEDVLRRLAAFGIRFAIDDFGTGYSSLAYLRRFPVAFLKIDRAFVERVAHDAEDQSIVAAMVGLAHSLDCLVIAEGVETREQLERLRLLGCDFGQGYLWSPAVPASRLQLQPVDVG